MAAGSDLDVQVAVQLAPGTDFRFSEISDVDQLTVTARQTGVGAFTDWAVGTISIGTGPDRTADPGRLRRPRPVPGDQSPAPTGDDDIRAGNGKAIVLGLGGDDTIHGGNGKDCLVGGDGDDTLFGGNAPDIMIGGTGFDTCHGGRAPNTPWDCEAPLEATSLAPLSLAVGEEADVELAESEPGVPGPEEQDPGSEDPAAEDAGTEDPAAAVAGGGSS